MLPLLAMLQGLSSYNQHTIKGDQDAKETKQNYSCCLHCGLRDLSQRYLR